MPRGSGKSSLCEVAGIWSQLYGHREFLVLIGATEGAAVEMMDSIKTELETNEYLFADFPEVCYPIRQLDGKWNFIAHDNPRLYPKRMRGAIEAGVLGGGGIWHFAGGSKPWRYPWRECAFVWWRYARMSPYYEELLMDLSLAAAGAPDRLGLAAQRARERAVRSGASDPGERKLKYLLPYGFMCRYVRRRYGIEVDKPLFCSKNPLVILWRLLKFTMPYGLVVRLSGLLSPRKGS